MGRAKGALRSVGGAEGDPQSSSLSSELPASLPPKELADAIGITEASDTEGFLVLPVELMDPAPL